VATMKFHLTNFEENGSLESTTRHSPALSAVCIGTGTIVDDGFAQQQSTSTTKIARDWGLAPSPYRDGKNFKSKTCKEEQGTARSRKRIV
jgi:hypothetical protein